MNDKSNTSRFEYVDGTSSVGAFYKVGLGELPWDNNEPKDGNCVVVNSREFLNNRNEKWVSRECNREQRFVCKKKNSVRCLEEINTSVPTAAETLITFSPTKANENDQGEDAILNSEVLDYILGGIALTLFISLIVGFILHRKLTRELKRTKAELVLDFAMESAMNNNSSL